MALISITAETGCPIEELARLAAARLNYQLVTAYDLECELTLEFGSITIPDHAWADAVQLILCRLATRHHLLLAFPGANHLFPGFASTLRVHLTAPEPHRIGHFMLEHSLDRPAAKRRLNIATRKAQTLSNSRFKTPPPTPGLTLANWNPDQAAALIESAAACLHLTEQGPLTGTTQFEFDLRLTLAGHGIAPQYQSAVKATAFSHPSEQLFANLLDFYRIPWLYEPRSFPLQWNEAGAVTEAFAPDFYLPESDLYIELTTMKQSLVTRKNRKVKRLKAIYPHINIQIFYQKDFQDLVFKYGLRATDH